MGYIALGDLISKAQVEKCGKRDYPVLSMTMHDGIVFQNNRFKKDIASIDRSNYSVVGFNQLVVSFPIDEGVLAVQDITDAGIVSPAYKIWDIDQAKIVPKYLEMWLRSPRSIGYYKSKLRGTTARRRSIPEEDFLGMRVNVPPKEEQERIVDLITRVKGVILLREQELVALDDLIKAQFVEMFGGGKYETVKASGVCDFITKGTTPPGDEIVEDYQEGLIPFLKVYNLSFSGELLFDTAPQYISREVHDGKLARSKVYPNDVLMNIVGPPLGKFSLVSDEFEEWNINQAIAIFRAKEQVLPRYLMAALMQPNVLRPFLEQAVGIRQLNLSLEQCRNLEFSLPPLEEQRAFVEFSLQIDKSKSVIQKSLDETQLLFDSLMQKYFG